METKEAKKSQAALEFLMTYGWAIMVVLVAISALAYFGVLSPDKFLPDRCVLPSGIVCVDFEATNFLGPGFGELYVSVKNSIGYDLTQISLYASGCQGVGITANLKNGETRTLTASECSGLDAGKRYEGDINITYTNKDTGLQHKAQGKVIVKPEDKPI